ncbi:MAG: ERAP1-like C-terminal domain-containing protein [Chloracidobacterium sp.]|nr:ERAP1-like C-terminal domain-containing protein [Chloracidobacterium sp.]
MPKGNGNSSDIMKVMLFRVLFITFFAAMTAFAQQSAPPIEPGVSQALAQWRAARYSDVRYKLNLTLEKMSPVLKGTMEIRVNVLTLPRGVNFGRGLRPNGAPSPSPMRQPDPGIPAIILDWRKIKGSESLSTISNVTINGKPMEVRGGGAFQITDAKPYIIEDREHLIFGDGVVAGENVIKLDFTSPILTSGSAITRYVDKEDGAEYIYSLFVPSDASTAFPVFDQPDLKARFALTVVAPTGWEVISNSELPPIENMVRILKLPQKYSITNTFAETKPISTYVFAFAAGPFEAFADKGGNLSGSEGVLARDKESTLPTPKNTLPTGRVSASDTDLASHIYVRKSQAKKFEPHSKEIFRLNREGIKYLETYFDYKFPWPKYDLVLIPEFPFGGMEHAGATFLREASIIFPTEPTKSDHISRANLIFHEAAHQWFGDTVTMRWFDDLWLKEGFAEFMAYKTLEKVMPEANAWKVFYERNKQAAYATDSTKGTTPIYQKIDNLSAAKSAYGNIVYRKAPSFLRQAEFYLGEQKFQTAARAFLKKHEYANATWKDLVREFETAAQFQNRQLDDWASQWIETRGVPKMRVGSEELSTQIALTYTAYDIRQLFNPESNNYWQQKIRIDIVSAGNREKKHDFIFGGVNVGGNAGYHTKSFLSVSRDPRAIEDQQRQSIGDFEPSQPGSEILLSSKFPVFIFPNYQDYGYGIFLLDDKSREYVLKNIQNEKDPFLRSMMWGSLWDSVREAELDPKVYVELVVKNLATEQDETIVSSILGRVGTAMNYYLPDAQRNAIAPRLETILLDRLQHAPTAGQRITFYRAFVTTASTAKGREVLKEMLAQGSSATRTGENHPVGETPTPLLRKEGSQSAVPLRTKDRFDIVTRLIILGDADAPKRLAQLEKTETGDDAKRYAYAARAGFATAENKAKYWSDFTANKDISESWIEAAFGPFNSVRHSDLTLPYLERALAELPNHKRTRKIFFVNGWLGAFIGGQKSETALSIVNKFLADNPNLDRDLRLKILENVDLIERAVKIRSKYR